MKIIQLFFSLADEMRGLRINSEKYRSVQVIIPLFTLGGIYSTRSLIALKLVERSKCMKQINS